MAAVIDVTEANAESYGRKLQWNLTQSGRNQKRLPGGRIISLSPDDHYKKLNKRYSGLCQEPRTAQHGTSQNLKQIQGDKITEKGEG